MYLYKYLWLIYCYYWLQQSDPVVEKLYTSTEEGQKVTRNEGDKFLAVYRRIADAHEQKIEMMDIS